MQSPSHRLSSVFKRKIMKRSRFLRHYLLEAGHRRHEKDLQCT